MTPERWRIIDQVLDVALACDPARRDAVVADACAGDDALRREVESLLAAHDRAAGDDFLERPAAEALGAAAAPSLTERLATALAGRYVIEREVGRGGAVAAAQPQQRLGAEALRARPCLADQPGELLPSCRPLPGKAINIHRGDEV